MPRLSTRARYAGAAAVGLALTVVFVLGLDLVAALPTALVRTFFDDAFYYFQIARHIALGHGFTFDGLHRTNGFQPLWLFLVVPIFRFVPGDLAPLYTVVALQIALVALAAVGIFALLQRRIGVAGAFAAGLFVAAQPDAKILLRSGMETPLVLALLVSIWWLRARVHARPADAGRWALLGLACAALLWSRLEAALFIPMLALCDRRILRAHPRRVVAWLAPITVALAAYLVWNRTAFDVWLPLSGTIKLMQRLTPPRPSYLRTVVEMPWVGHELFCKLIRSSIYDASLALKIIYLVLMLTIVVAAFRFRLALRDSIRRAQVGFLLAGCAVVWLVQLLTLLCLDEWHGYPLLVSTAIVVGLVVGRLGRWASPAALTLLLIAVGHTIDTRDNGRGKPSEIDCLFQAVDWTKDHIGREEPIGSWNAGRFAYFSHRTVVNLDGYVNDERFFNRVIVGHDLTGYLTMEKIDWLADYYPQLIALQPDTPDLERLYPRRAEFRVPAFGGGFRLFQRAQAAPTASPP